MTTGDGRTSRTHFDNDCQKVATGRDSAGRGRGRGRAASGPGAPAGGLTLADVLDLRAYERVREDYRARVIARKRNRRVALGPIMTLVFECFDTVRFQVQEMARVEKIISDEAIQVELDIYNRLLPGEGELSATLFIELTSDEALREWLPRLVGIERQLGVSIDGERGGQRPRGRARRRPSPGRTVTPAVHYLRFGFTEAQVVAFGDAAEVALVATHPAYEATDRARAGGAGRAARGPARAQQSRCPSADQGQFRARVFTDASGRKPYSSFAEFRAAPSVAGPKGPPDQGECKYPPVHPLLRKCFP